MVLYTLCDCDCDSNCGCKGTLEPTVKKIEEKFGIPVYYAPSDSIDMDISNPYPIQDMPQQDTFNSQRENNESGS